MPNLARPTTCSGAAFAEGPQSSWRLPLVLSGTATGATKGYPLDPETTNYLCYGVDPHHHVGWSSLGALHDLRKVFRLGDRGAWLSALAKAAYVKRSPDCPSDAFATAAYPSWATVRAVAGRGVAPILGVAVAGGGTGRGTGIVD